MVEIEKNVLYLLTIHFVALKQMIFLDLISWTRLNARAFLYLAEPVDLQIGVMDNVEREKLNVIDWYCRSTPSGSMQNSNWNVEVLLFFSNNSHQFPQFHQSKQELHLILGSHPPTIEYSQGESTSISWYFWIGLELGQPEMTALQCCQPPPLSLELVEL